MRKSVIGLILFAAAISGFAFAQSDPGFVTGQIPTAAQWNGYFDAKMDYPGTLPHNTVMAGPASPSGPAALAAPRALVAADIPTLENRQALLSVSSGTQGAGTTLYYPCDGAVPAGNSTEAQVEQVMPFSGTFRNLYAISSVAPGITAGYTINVRVNGADPTSGPICIITPGSATSCNDTGNTANFNPGDTCDIRVQTNGLATPAFFTVAMEADNP